MITIRGLNALRICDTVIYDSLLAQNLLSYVPNRAEKIDVGKRSGKHSAKQSEICELLLSKAREGKTVIRLKGGDPFVFGRGGEEALALQQAGINYEVIPGVSSAFAIPALVGIPVTHRGVSQSVHVVTAHTADTPDGLPICLEQLAQISGTLVFLMGLNQLSRIVQRLTQAGMVADTPVAVISGGSGPNPICIRGTLADMEQRVQEAQVQTPAVIVVGAVAAMDLRSIVQE